MLTVAFVGQPPGVTRGARLTESSSSPWGEGARISLPGMGGRLSHFPRASEKSLS